jgi:hypothetical protein
MRLNGARTQGAFGALAGRTVRCDDVTVQTPNVHCAVIVTSLDGRPIRESSRLLVSAVGRSQNQAMPAERQPLPEGSDEGMPPCLMEPVRGAVTIRTDLANVAAVDAGGYAVGSVETSRTPDGGLAFDLEGAPGVLYYVIER